MYVPDDEREQVRRSFLLNGIPRDASWAQGHINFLPNCASTSYKIISKSWAFEFELVGIKLKACMAFNISVYHVF